MWDRISCDPIYVMLSEKTLYPGLIGLVTDYERKWDESTGTVEMKLRDGQYVTADESSLVNVTPFIEFCKDMKIEITTWNGCGAQYKHVFQLARELHKKGIAIPEECIEQFKKEGVVLDCSESKLCLDNTTGKHTDDVPTIFDSPLYQNFTKAFAEAHVYVMTNLKATIPGKVGELPLKPIKEWNKKIETIVVDFGYLNWIPIPIEHVIVITPLINFCKDNNIDIYTSDKRGYRNMFEILNDLSKKDVVMPRDTVANMETMFLEFGINNDSDTSKIIDVKQIVLNKVVEVMFADGTKEKAVCKDGDVFSLETGISICVAKHAMGGSSAYNKAVKQGMKVYNEKLESERIEKEREAIAERKREKHRAYKARRAAKRKAESILMEENEINRQKEAFVRAIEELKEKYGN